MARLRQFGFQRLKPYARLSTVSREIYWNIRSKEIAVQKIATRIFTYASIVFGVVGILVVLTASGPNKADSALSELLIKLLFVTVFIILPSFALSVAGKYLNDKS
jgi:hypothetical protein